MTICLVGLVEHVCKKLGHVSLDIKLKMIANILSSMRSVVRNFFVRNFIRPRHVDAIFTTEACKGRVKEWSDFVSRRALIGRHGDLVDLPDKEDTRVFDNTSGCFWMTQHLDVLCRDLLDRILDGGDASMTASYEKSVLLLIDYCASNDHPLTYLLCHVVLREINGQGEDSEATRRWIDVLSEYPDAFEGHVAFECDDELSKDLYLNATGIAALHGRADLVKHLLSKAQPEDTDKGRFDLDNPTTPLACAARGNSLELAKYLLDSREYGQMELSNALANAMISRAGIDCAVLLFSRGVFIGRPWMETLLRYAYVSGVVVNSDDPEMMFNIMFRRFREITLVVAENYHFSEILHSVCGLPFPGSVERSDETIRDIRNYGALLLSPELEEAIRHMATRTTDASAFNDGVTSLALSLAS
jgi:hypothetical protein